MNASPSVPVTPIPPKPANSRAALRHQARHLLVQALYQWHMAGQPISEIEAQFRVDNDFNQVDGAYFHDLLQQVAQQQLSWDAFIEPCLDRSLREMDPVELAILRLSTCELSYRIDVPYRVIINEGVELAKAYGATDGHKFINGVLDKLAPQLRPTEYNVKRRK